MSHSQLLYFCSNAAILFEVLGESYDKNAYLFFESPRTIHKGEFYREIRIRLTKNINLLEVDDMNNVDRETIIGLGYDGFKSVNGIILLSDCYVIEHITATATYFSTIKFLKACGCRNIYNCARELKDTIKYHFLSKFFTRNEMYKSVCPNIFSMYSLAKCMELMKGATSEVCEEEEEKVPLPPLEAVDVVPMDDIREPDAQYEDILIDDANPIPLPLVEDEVAIALKRSMIEY